MGDIREKNKAARAQIQTTIGASKRQGNITTDVDVLEGTSKIVIYPSSILPSQFDYSLKREPIVTEKNIDERNNSELKANLDIISTQEPYAKGMVQLYQQYSNSSNFNVILGEGISISTIGINKRSLKSKPSEKSKSITDSANKILAEMIGVKNRSKEFLEQRIEDLKEQKAITSSSMYTKYARIIGKVSKIATDRTPFNKRGSGRSLPNDDTVKNKYFYNQKALVKYRTSIKNDRDHDPYSYVTKTVENPNRPTPRRRKPGLKAIKIVKFEPIGEQNLQIANETVFMEVE